MYTEVRLGFAISLRGFTSCGISCVRGKNTCEAPDISAAIFWQVWEYGWGWFSLVSGQAREVNARKTTQKRDVVKAME